MTKLKTISFIGSDKNAGKTTALNFIYSILSKKQKNIVLMSIGINGESYDSLENHPKPKITVLAGNYFITESQHLKTRDGLFTILKLYTPPTFKKTFALCKAKIDQDVILEGPNEKQEILLLKDSLNIIFKSGTILLDGSIDRQFIASNEISDEFYFALLFTNRKEQMKKLKNLLRPLSYPPTSKVYQKIIAKSIASNIKTILMDASGKVVYKSNQISFLDNDLLTYLNSHKNKQVSLYINGAITNKLIEMLSPYKNVNIILDSFTQEMTTNIHEFKVDHSNKYLLNKVELSGIFLKEECNIKTDIDLPFGVPVYNLYRDERINEIRN